MTSLTHKEYERRRDFSKTISTLTISECVEILRILKKHDVPYTENQNGIFFNVIIVPQDVFDKMEEFIQFALKNRTELSSRSALLSSLSIECIVKPAI